MTSCLNLSTGHCTVATPIGEILIQAREDGITAVYFEGRWSPDVLDAGWRDERRVPVLQWARTEVEAYFAGTLRTFTVPLRLAGTPFQLQVWSALQAIPFGETVSYQRIAESIGRPTACRAVGAANGRNPLPIIIPCHRVIGADGTLTGFGGGLGVKRWLLEHEHLAPSRPVP